MNLGLGSQRKRGDGRQRKRNRAVKKCAGRRVSCWRKGEAADGWKGEGPDKKSKMKDGEISEAGEVVMTESWKKVAGKRSFFCPR